MHIIPFFTDTNSMSDKEFAKSDTRLNKWREDIYESNGNSETYRLMRYNRTRLRKPHKCRVFDGFVQTKTQGIRRQIDQIHKKGKFAIRIQKDSVSENCHRGPGHSDYRPGFFMQMKYR